MNKHVFNFKFTGELGWSPTTSNTGEVKNHQALYNFRMVEKVVTEKGWHEVATEVQLVVPLFG